MLLLLAFLLTGCDSLRVGEKAKFCVGVCAELELKHHVQGAGTEEKPILPCRSPDE